MSIDKVKLAKNISGNTSMHPSLCAPLAKPLVTNTIDIQNIALTHFKIILKKYQDTQHQVLTISLNKASNGMILLITEIYTDEITNRARKGLYEFFLDLEINCFLIEEQNEARNVPKNRNIFQNIQKAISDKLSKPCTNVLFRIDIQDITKAVKTFSEILFITKMTNNPSKLLKYHLVTQALYAMKAQLILDVKQVSYIDKLCHETPTYSLYIKEACSKKIIFTPEVEKPYWDQIETFSENHLLQATLQRLAFKLNNGIRKHNQYVRKLSIDWPKIQIQIDKNLNVDSFSEDLQTKGINNAKVGENTVSMTLFITQHITDEHFAEKFFTALSSAITTYQDITTKIAKLLQSTHNIMVNGAEAEISVTPLHGRTFFYNTNNGARAAMLLLNEIEIFCEADGASIILPTNIPLQGILDQLTDYTATLTNTINKSTEIKEILNRDQENTEKTINIENTVGTYTHERTPCISYIIVLNTAQKTFSSDYTVNLIQHTLSKCKTVIHTIKNEQQRSIVIIFADKKAVAETIAHLILETTSIYHKVTQMIEMIQGIDSTTTAHLDNKTLVIICTALYLSYKQDNTLSQCQISPSTGKERHIKIKLETIIAGGFNILDHFNIIKASDIDEIESQLLIALPSATVAWVLYRDKLAITIDSTDTRLSITTTNDKIKIERENKTHTITMPTNMIPIFVDKPPIHCTEINRYRDPAIAIGGITFCISATSTTIILTYFAKSQNEFIIFGTSVLLLEMLLAVCTSVFFYTHQNTKLSDASIKSVEEFRGIIND